MKHKFFLIACSLLFATMVFAQENNETSIPLIGDDAPTFTAETTKGTLHFPEDYGKKWKIIFSHPHDFTPVCSSELLELAYLQNDFDELGVKLVIVSDDDLEFHKNWKKSLESLSYKNREPVEIQFPLVDDKSKVIAKKYGMIHPSNPTTEYVRGDFIIDPDNKVRAISFSPMQVGRNIEDIKRTVIALQTTESSAVMTPADWQPGEDVLVPYVKSDKKGDPKVANKDDQDLYQIAWYMVFKPMN